jgi:hypothetical protein
MHAAHQARRQIRQGICADQQLDPVKALCFDKRRQAMPVAVKEARVVRVD